MARLAVIFLAILLAFGLSGCAESKRPQCEGDCETPGPSQSNTTPPTTEPGVDPNPILNRPVEFSNCAGVGAATNLPYYRVRPLVPEDFRLLGVTPESVNANVHGFLCDRIVIEATVYEDVYYFNSYVMVSPRNESRGGKGLDFFLLDQRFSSVEVASYVETLGMPSGVGTFKVSSTSVPDSGALQQWSISDAESGFALSALSHSPSSVGGGPACYWSGTETLRRVDFDMRYHYRGPSTQAGSVVTEGSSPTERAYGDRHPAIVYSPGGFNMTWLIESDTVFEAEEAD